MERIEFRVQGSMPEPYVVIFAKQDENLSARCTCKAADLGNYCKHRENILYGSTKGIVSKNIEDGEKKTMVTELEGENHNIAIRSYEQRLTISCLGDIVKEGKVYRLKNPRDLRLIQEP